MSRPFAGRPVPRLPPLDDLDGLAPPAPGASFRDWGRLVLGSAWRRRWVAALVFLVGVLTAAAYYRFKTPLYRVEARIHAQRQQALPGAVRPGAPDDLPTRSAWEVIHRRDTLLLLARDVQRGASSPTSLLDRARQRLRGLKALLGGSEGSGVDPEPDVDPVENVARRLDRALEVSAADGTITVAIEWPDPRQAHQIVEGAVQNFLEARHVQEVNAIDEVIALLHARAAALRENLDRAIEEDRHQATDRFHASRSAPSAAPSPGSQELARVKSLLDSRERAVADVDDYRRRRLTELQAQLDAQRTVYSEAHPVIVNLRKDIESLSRESPQVAALREEEGKLRAEYQARLAQERGARRPSVMPGEVLVAPMARPEESERVRDARFQLQRMLERIGAAQLELDAARAAFKYRYRVIWPPEVPRFPVSPKPARVVLVGLLLSFTLAVLVAAGPDLWSGRVLERWQIERSLDVPVLGEIRRR